MPKALLRLPAGDEKVFDSYEEFVAHHFGISLAEAKAYLEALDPNMLMDLELHKQEVQKL